MTPWLRVVGATVVLVAGAAVQPSGSAAASFGPGAVYGAPSTRDPSASPAPPTPPTSSSSSSPRGESPSGEPSRADRPDEERDRPGRHEDSPERRHDERERERERDGADDGGAGVVPRKPGRADGGAHDRPDAEDMPGPWDDERAVPEAPDVDTVPAAPTSQAAVPVPSATSGTPEPDTVSATEPVLRILPLGSGLMLIGLGFGLAFVALRMRQRQRSGTS
ncbi:hypothetical protein SHKM778_00760 [Streptomyces sp. KM77-8]|uniref:Uncharacterized protein n=1 Tax=Streptomyces haneummycinicus TaxID=3074435 RepID=A0AAT9H8Q0_9ACTN